MPVEQSVQEVLEANFDRLDQAIEWAMQSSELTPHFRSDLRALRQYLSTFAAEKLDLCPELTLPLVTAAEVGKALGNKGRKTGRRELERKGRVPIYEPEKAPLYSLTPPERINRSTPSSSPSSNDPAGHTNEPK